MQFSKKLRGQLRIDYMRVLCAEFIEKLHHSQALQMAELFVILEQEANKLGYKLEVQQLGDETYYFVYGRIAGHDETIKSGE